MDAKTKITKARAGLILDQPFFGSLALRMGLREDATCPTAYTDGQVMGYNPDFIEGLSLDQTKGLIAHEVMHVACSHHTRRQDRDPGRWNQAGDYAINDILVDSGFTLPDDGLKGMGTDKSAEEIYGQIPEPVEQDGDGDGQQGQGQDPGGCGEVRDYPGKDGQTASQAELAQAEQDAKVAVAQAAQQAKNMGNLPAGVARLVEEILEPKVDWREVLRQFIETNARNDYSWTPPNRRYVHMGLYLPSLRSEELGDVVIAVDTSSSISNNDVSQFAAEVSSILEEYDTTCSVVYCDTDIAGIETFSRDDLPLDLHPAGGGGTDFRPPFVWVDEQDITPACMIYLTDLECSRFPDAPGYPVLWAHLGKFGETPPFGEVIKL